MKVNERIDHPERSVKRKYVAPKVIVYGNIAEITKALGNMGATDGGSGSTSKTQ